MERAIMGRSRGQFRRGVIADADGHECVGEGGCTQRLPAAIHSRLQGTRCGGRFDPCGWRRGRRRHAGLGTGGGRGLARQDQQQCERKPPGKRPRVTDSPTHEDELSRSAGRVVWAFAAIFKTA